MATVAMTIEEVMFKIAMRKIMQRIGIYTATTTVPLVGQAIMLGLLTYDLYQIVKYYNNNKDKIDTSFSAAIENQYSLLKSEWAKVQQLQQENSTGGNLPPDDDLIKKIIDFCEKVGNFVKNSISGELTTTEKEMIETEINEFTTKTLGGFLSNFNKVLFPFVLPFVFPTQADASENNPNQKGKAQEKFHKTEGSECTPKDPIIFDLNNDGVLETTDINNGIYFDHENDGFAEASAWVGENDGILVVDSNNNGKIDNGTEVLLHSTLAAFDTNNDGIIDANDADFNNLKILKGDGTLMSLTEAGIISINLNTTATDITDENGNKQFASGTFTRADGTTGTFGEFLVKTETSNSIATEWLEETADIENLPDIAGRGIVYSLHQAMLRDESGELVA